MTQAVEKKLKDIFTRLSKGFSITLNELVFLSRYDEDGFVKTYRKLVPEAPDPQLDASVTEEPSPSYEIVPVYGNIDLVINNLRYARPGTDLVVGITSQKVLELVQDQIQAQEAGDREAERFFYYYGDEKSTWDAMA